MTTQNFTNWFKLMCGLSMLIVSVCFLINTISPAHASSENKINNITSVANSTNASTGIMIGADVYFVDGGFLYKWNSSYSCGDKANWKKYRLTTLPEKALY